MNFLAHLHLAHLANSSLSGNLLADFVRGNPAEDYSPEVVDGIFMHRRIDVLTDEPVSIAPTIRDSARVIESNDEFSLRAKAAVKALGDGDLGDVSRSLTVAFSAVILALIAAALGDVARARNLSQLARDVDGDPSLATVVKVAHALGLRLAFKPAHAGGPAPVAGAGV